MLLWVIVGLFAVAALLCGRLLRRGRRVEPRGNFLRAQARRDSFPAEPPEAASDESDGGSDESDGPPGGLRRRRARSGSREAEPAGGAALSRLQRKKLEKTRERAARQEARSEQQRAREDAARQRQESEERRERDEAAREAAEEEALEELRAERRRREDEEYAKWAGGIGVEGRGEMGDEERLQRERVDAFLTERAREVDTRAADGAQEAQESATNIIVLGDVARSFGVSAETLAQRIERLLADGAVNGVFDDRGKFVFVAEVHFRRLATFLQQRGRVSVRELARECNRVILA